MKLAVLFPGIGYTCDKPLLYYAARLAREKGYQVRPLPYGPFPAKVRGDAELMRRCFDIAWTQAEAMLKDVVWEDCEDILFIGKSIGTTVAARYAREHGLSARCALLTPLEETFLFTRGDAVAFHGTGDPWADTARRKQRAERVDDRGHGRKDDGEHHHARDHQDEKVPLGLVLFE